MTDPVLHHPEQFPPTQSEATLAGPAGDLEAMLNPSEEAPTQAIAIICHSVSADGGTLHSKVVQMMERSLRELGAHTIRFNFRGVGESSGEFDRGYGESEDLIAVAQWARQVLPDLPLWIAGYGFGAFVTARAATSIHPDQLISVSPLLDEFDFDALPRAQCPWLIVQGDADEFVNADDVYQWANALDGDTQLIAMQDVNHDYHRRLMDLRGVIKNGVRRQLKS
ncbi:MAG: alpha/beta hydrolase [Lysobacterales bacterium]